MSKLNNFPTIEELYSVNYLLLIVADLSADADVCELKTAKTICSAQVFSGRAMDFKRTLDLAGQIRFIESKHSNLRLTSSGKDFINLNDNLTYEISEKQRDYLIEKVVFKGIWKSHSRGLFLSFSPNYKLFTFEFPIKELSVPEKYIPVFRILKNFKIIELKNEVAYVSPLYVRHVRDLVSTSSLSQEGLEKLLEADKELGFRAEEEILKFEQRRLKNMGRTPESELVRRISQLDVTAGYDIASFDGNTAEIIHNRYIEVKASKQGKVRFYWSLNELEKAKELGNKYWIYFLGNFGTHNQENVEPIMIQNPANVIANSSKFIFKVVKYLVEETN
jgi:hypothetical protein